MFSRWTTPKLKLNHVQQFWYERLHDLRIPDVSRPRRTQAQRYTEAVRATHLIANELADIEEDSEFDKMLAFVLQQWRDVRQRLRIPDRLHSSATESRVIVDDAAVLK
jgi:hypothetical protein